MAKNLEELSIEELVALNKATDIVLKKYENIFEMHKGNVYGDTESSADDRTSALFSLNLLKEKKEKILKELEKRIYENV